jgi:hypothetical protein
MSISPKPGMWFMRRASLYPSRRDALPSPFPHELDPGGRVHVCPGPSLADQTPCASGDDVRGCRRASGGGCCGALPGAPIWVTARRIDSVFTRQQTGPNGINLWAWTPNLGSGCREMRHRSPSAHPCHLTDPQRDRDRAAPALPLTTCLVTGSGCPAPSEDRHSGPLQSSLATRSRRTESRCARYGAAPSGAPRPASRRTRSKRAAPRPTAPAPRSRRSGRPHSRSPALHCPSSRCESR